LIEIIPRTVEILMTKLRIVTVALVASTAIGLTPMAADAAVHPLTTQSFDGVGQSVSVAYNFALAAAEGDGYLKSQCRETKVTNEGGGWWDATATCTK
jgi:hypothetical protein